MSSVVNDLGVEVFGISAIKNEYRNEFIKRLQPAQMDTEMKMFERLTMEMSALCVELSAQQRSKDFTEKDLDAVISMLKSGKAYLDNFPPEIFIHGGVELKKFILCVVNAVKNKQEIPPQWAVVKITTLYKKKGSLKKLVNQRGIFLTPIISKIFEKLIKGRINECVERVSIWQAGS